MTFKDSGWLGVKLTASFLFMQGQGRVQCLLHLQKGTPRCSVRLVRTRRTLGLRIRKEVISLCAEFGHVRVICRFNLKTRTLPTTSICSPEKAFLSFVDRIFMFHPNFAAHHCAVRNAHAKISFRPQIQPALFLRPFCILALVLKYHVAQVGNFLLGAVAHSTSIHPRDQTFDSQALKDCIIYSSSIKRLGTVPFGVLLYEFTLS
jgi:hypothetical protein